MATLQTFLQRRGNRYHFRCRVPSDLVDRLGRREIVRALGTSCPKEACQKVLLMAAQTFAAFEGLRMSGNKEKGTLGGVEPDNELWVSDDMFGMGDDPAPTQPKPVAPPKDVTVP